MYSVLTGNSLSNILNNNTKKGKTAFVRLPLFVFMHCVGAIVAVNRSAI